MMRHIPKAAPPKSSGRRYLAGSRVRETMTTRVSSSTQVIANSAHPSDPAKLSEDIEDSTGAARTAAMTITSACWPASADAAGTGVCMSCPVASEWKAKTAKSSAARASNEMKGEREPDATVRLTARSNVMSPTSLPSAQGWPANLNPVSVPHAQRRILSAGFHDGAPQAGDQFPHQKFQKVGVTGNARTGQRKRSR